MSLYKEQLERPAKNKKDAKFRKWVKNQHNRWVRRNLKDTKAYKFFKYWET